jgi:hypothetical protein
MRDRLVELISKARAECASTSCFQCEYQDKETPKDCVPRLIEDHLLANGVILPPCKVGDAVYYINLYNHIMLYKHEVYEAKVVRLVVTRYGVSPVIRVKSVYSTYEIPGVEFGKNVFHTREEAEQALKGEKL